MVVFYPKVRDRNWLYGRKNRTFVLFLSITILLIGVAFIGYYYWSAMDYNRAEYKADVTATLVRISDDKQPVYEYYWKYEINSNTDNSVLFCDNINRNRFVFDFEMYHY